MTATADTAAGFRAAPTGLVIAGEPGIAAWRDTGAALQKASGSLLWAVGDWLNYGESKWGEVYTQARELTGLDYGTLRVAKHVCKKFDLLSRDNRLGFHHHRFVASLPIETAKALLTRAFEEGWTTRRMLAESRQVAGTVSTEVDADPAPALPLVLRSARHLCDLIDRAIGETPDATRARHLAQMRAAVAMELAALNLAVADIEGTFPVAVESEPEPVGAV